MTVSKIVFPLSIQAKSRISEISVEDSPTSLLNPNWPLMRLGGTFPRLQSDKKKKFLFLWKGSTIPVTFKSCDVQQL